MKLCSLFNDRVELAGNINVAKIERLVVFQRDVGVSSNANTVRLQKQKTYETAAV